jgi:hypothetical protein
VLVPGAVELVALGLGSYWGARSIIQNSPVESRARMYVCFFPIACPDVKKSAVLQTLAFAGFSRLSMLRAP